MNVVAPADNVWFGMVEDIMELAAPIGHFWHVLMDTDVQAERVEPLTQISECLSLGFEFRISLFAPNRVGIAADNFEACLLADFRGGQNFLNRFLGFAVLVHTSA